MTREFNISWEDSSYICKKKKKGGAYAYSLRSTPYTSLRQNKLACGVVILRSLSYLFGDRIDRRSWPLNLGRPYSVLRTTGESGMLRAQSLVIVEHRKIHGTAWWLLSPKSLPMPSTIQCEHLLLGWATCASAKPDLSEPPRFQSTKHYICTEYTIYVRSNY